MRSRPTLPTFAISPESEKAFSELMEICGDALWQAFNPSLAKLAQVVFGLATDQASGGDPPSLSSILAPLGLQDLTTAWGTC